MIQGFALIVLPFAAVLLWIGLRRTAPLSVTVAEALELGAIVWIGLFALIATLYFRTH
ncbi:MULTISPECIES: hypothetical protein [unclassified Bradyrhizobium]|uniref:hypothetical protein n=1 Tax=unclassified Bradyrhizobium TaxID=2631580 RepID=UPI0015F05BAE|nr:MULTISPECIES: hypothetical protein [unclassified Bradyrhizobium]